MENEKHGLGKRLRSFLAECGLMIRAMYNISGHGMVVTEPNPPKPVNVSDDDPEMEAAMTEARNTLDSFLRELEVPRDRKFYIKAAFPTTAGRAEHVWIAHVSLHDGVFQGTVSNVPKQVEGLSIGRKVSVPIADVSDWMIKDGTTTFGGTTTRVLGSRSKK